MKGKVKGPCPVCGRDRLFHLQRLRECLVPLQFALVNQPGSIASPKGDISLGICENCTHLYNYSFDPTDGL